MRILSVIALSALVALSTIALLHPAIAKAPAKQTAPSPAPADTVHKTVEYLVKNQNGLVTVQEKDGPFVFAQVMSTSKLKVELSDGGKVAVLRITLRDEKNNKMWETKMGDGSSSYFGFNWAYGDDKDSGVVHLSVTPREGVTTGANAPNPKGTILIGGDGLPYLADIRTDDTSMHLERKGDSFVLSHYENENLVGTDTMSMDATKKTVSASTNGKTITITGTGNSGGPIVKATIVTKNGKSFTRIDIGDQHILLDGSGYQVNVDGDDIIVSPASAPK